MSPKKVFRKIAEKSFIFIFLSNLFIWMIAGAIDIFTKHSTNPSVSSWVIVLGSFSLPFLLLFKTLCQEMVFLDDRIQDLERQLQADKPSA